MSQLHLPRDKQCYLQAQSWNNPKFFETKNSWLLSHLPADGQTIFNAGFSRAEVDKTKLGQPRISFHRALVDYRAVAGQVPKEGNLELLLGPQASCNVPRKRGEVLFKPFFKIWQARNFEISFKQFYKPFKDLFLFMKIKVPLCSVFESRYWVCL